MINLFRFNKSATQKWLVDYEVWDTQATNAKWLTRKGEGDYVITDQYANKQDLSPETARELMLAQRRFLNRVERALRRQREALEMCLVEEGGPPPPLEDEEADSAMDTWARENEPFRFGALQFEDVQIPQDE